jgi:hypothetical protein
LTSNDFLVFKPPPSKPDPFCEVWGAKPVYIRYSDTNEINMAFWAAQQMLRFPVPASQRDSTPLFRDNNGEAIAAQWYSAKFRQMLLEFMPLVEAEKYSTHSFRIFLACAAHAAGASDSCIQALCRWRSAESLHTYIRMNPAE